MFDSLEVAITQAELQLALLKDKLAAQTAEAWVAITVMDDNEPEVLYRKETFAASPKVKKVIQIDPEDADEKIVVCASMGNGGLHVVVIYYESYSTSIEKRERFLKFGEWVDIGGHSFQLAHTREEADALVVHLDTPGEAREDRLAAFHASDYPSDEVWEAQKACDREVASFGCGDQCEQTPTLGPRPVDVSDEVVDTLIEGLRPLE
jgi:hypothetical protein